MKKQLFLLITFCGLFNSLYSQKIAEPKFIGECIMVREDGTFVLLEKGISKNRSAANTSLLLTGYGSYNENIEIKGCCSKLIIPTEEDISLIIRAHDNNIDPLASIQIFKFKTHKKHRAANLTSINSFGTLNTNNLVYLPFEGERYGNNSYKLKLKNLTPGEYGIIIASPSTNNVVPPSVIVSTFAAI